MPLVAVIRCTEAMLWQMQAHRSWTTARKFAFLETKDWKYKGWAIGIFVAETPDRNQVIGLGLVQPRKMRLEIERDLKIEHFRLLSHAVDVKGLKEQLTPHPSIWEGSGSVTQLAGDRLIEVLRSTNKELDERLSKLVDWLNPPVPGGAAGEIRAQEKDATNLAMRAFGVPEQDLAALRRWRPPSSDVPFLRGLDERYQRIDENQLIQHDATHYFGMKAFDTTVAGIVSFNVGGRSLYVYNVNASKVETDLGVDLVYYREGHENFVLVQYKKMIKHSNGDWFYKPSSDSRVNSQLVRMRSLDEQCNDSDHHDLRLVHTPSFVKLCFAQPLAPDSQDLIPGMYYSRRQFELALETSRDTPDSKNRIGPTTVRRYFNNTMFTQLLNQGWIGSRGSSTEIVAKQIRRSRDSRRTMVFAVERSGDPPGNGNAPRFVQETLFG